MKKIIIILIALILITSFTFSANLNIGKDKLVKVNNRYITLSELETKYKEISDIIREEAQRPSKKEILEQMINNELILEDANKTKSLILDEKRVKQYIEYTKQVYTQTMMKKDPKFTYSDDKFKKYLEKEKNTTYEKFEEDIKNSILKEQYVMKKIEPKVIKLKDKKYTSKADFPIKMYNSKGQLKEYNSLKEFYDDNKSKYFLDSPIYVKHIYMSTVAQMGSDVKYIPKEYKDKKRKIMEDIYRRLLKGENFDTLCEMYSEDIDSSNYIDPKTGKTDRGYLGPLVKTGELAEIQNQQFGEELINKIFALSAGNYSPVLEGRLGYHIFYVIKKLKTDLMSFEEVQESIVEIFKNAEYQQILQEEYSNIIKELKKKASITYYSDEYK